MLLFFWRVLIFCRIKSKGGCVSKLNIFVFFIISLYQSAVLSATIRVGEGSYIDFGGSQVSSEDLSIDNRGEVDFGTSQVLLTNLSNQTNALINAASSVLSINGNWFNAGDFNAMTSTVQFLDGPTPVSEISGQTTFYNLTARTNSGKVLSFEAGSQHAITNSLELSGIAGNLLSIISDSSGEEAFLNLLQSASQLIDYVDVTDNYANGQVIAPGIPADYNSVQGSNVRGWFGVPLQFPVPSLSLFSLILLAALMLLVFLFNQKKQFN